MHNHFYIEVSDSHDISYVSDTKLSTTLKKLTLCHQDYCHGLVGQLETMNKDGHTRIHTKA